MKEHTMVRWYLSFYCLLLVSSILSAQRDSTAHIWMVANFLQAPMDSCVAVVGSPKLVESPYGLAVHFNGTSDGIFLCQNLLRKLPSYTLEVLFYPERNGFREQRFLHFGDVRGDRTLLELRLNDTLWVLDAYVKSGDSAKTLIDYNKAHGTEKWYHIALVVTGDSVIAYVNGEKELENPLTTTPQEGGQTSIGVRLTKQYWFKGSIAKLALSPSSLLPHQFLLLQPE